MACLVVEMINWGRNVELTLLYLSILLRLNIELYKVTRNHKVTFCLRNSQVMPDQSSKIDIMCNLADVSLSLNPDDPDDVPGKTRSSNFIPEIISLL